MDKLIKVIEATAKYFSMDGKIETIKEGNAIIVKYKNIDIQLYADVEVLRAIVLKDDRIYFYCYTDNTLRNDMSVDAFIRCHKDKLKEEEDNEGIDALDLEIIEMNGDNYIYTNTCDYYMELNGIAYILEPELKYLYNRNNYNEKVRITKMAADYIIDKCLEDLPL